MASEPTAPNLRLDWSRLLGFDLAERVGGVSAPAKLADARLGKLGAKIGKKPKP